jgi:hypothetical protein
MHFFTCSFAKKHVIITQHLIVNIGTKFTFLYPHKLEIFWSTTLFFYSSQNSNCYIYFIARLSIPYFMFRCFSLKGRLPTNVESWKSLLNFLATNNIQRQSTHVRQAGESAFQQLCICCSWSILEPMSYRSGISWLTESRN